MQSHGKCFSRILGCGFNHLSVFLLASFLWVRESRAHSHKLNVLQNELLSHAIPGKMRDESYPRKQRLEQEGRATIFIRNSRRFYTEKTSSFLLSTDSGISNPEPVDFLWPTQLPSVLADNTVGFSRNVPSQLKESALHFKPLKRESESGNTSQKQTTLPYLASTTALGGILFTSSFSIWSQISRSLLAASTAKGKMGTSRVQLGWPGFKR